MSESSVVGDVKPQSLSDAQRQALLRCADLVDDIESIDDCLAEQINRDDKSELEAERYDLCCELMDILESTDPMAEVEAWQELRRTATYYRR